jgi:PQQ-like domain
MSARSRWLTSISSAVAATVLLSGCWPVPGQNAGRQGRTDTETPIGVETIASLHQVWDADLGGGPAGDPVAAPHAVYVSGQSALHALRSYSGQARWTVTPTAPEAMLQPVIRGANVFVGRWDPTASASVSTDGLDVTVPLAEGNGNPAGDPFDGQVVTLRGGLALLWDTRHFQGRSGPPFWGATLTVRNLATGATFCCDGFYGLFGASPPPPSPVPLTLGSQSILAAGVGVNDPANPETTVGNGVRGISIESPTLCLDLYLCPSWGVPLDGSTSTPPVLSDDQRVTWVGTDVGTVYAVDTTTAAVIWSTPVGSAVTDSPALAGGSLFVPTASGELVVLDASTGALKWSGSAGSRIGQQPAVAGGVVFTGSADGTVAAFDVAGCGATTCPQLWSGSAGSAVTGAPAVSGGRLYVGTEDGRLVAFGL